MHRDPSPRCLADGCGHKEPLLPLMAFGPSTVVVPVVQFASFQIGGREIEPARKVQAVTVADVHILAQAMINAAPDGHKKLIIFADSRQDAAFQAGWMQDHARRIRPAAHDVPGHRRQRHAAVRWTAITDKLMEMFRKDQNLIDTLLPELTGEEAPATFGHNKWVPVHKALRYMVLREFTTGVRRTDCLESMGLAQVVYDGLTPQSKGLRAWAEMMGISPEEAVEAICLILDNWRRNRILYVTGDPIFSRYHAKDDPYIQAGLLPLREFRPEGLLLNGGPDPTTTPVADPGPEGGVGGPGPPQEVGDPSPTRSTWMRPRRLLWEFLTDEAKLLRKVTLRSQKEKPLAATCGRWTPKNWSWRRATCGIAARPASGSPPGTPRTPPAPATTATAPPSTEQPDQENYDVWLMGRPFVMVSAEEHTAQVPGEVRNKIEQDFKSRHGRTNCLVATPTLEMGVNIGALDMALMRNVPPRPSNYWQRAGRAGREERMAVVVTYCRRSPHDRYFFDDPLRLLGGAIEAPTFNLRNPLMVAKHIRSAILSELLLRSRQAGTGQGERDPGRAEGTVPDLHPRLPAG